MQIRNNLGRPQNFTSAIRFQKIAYFLGFQDGHYNIETWSGFVEPVEVSTAPLVAPSFNKIDPFF